MCAQKASASLLGRLRLLRRRCPRCSGRLVRYVALEERYTRSRPVRGAARPLSGRLLQADRPGGIARMRVTPVYFTCPGCGYRARVKSLIEPME